MQLMGEGTKPKVYTYRLTHDLGLAPNPFFKFCTLTCCKPGIRKMASVGDYVVGAAGVAVAGRAYTGHAIYYMKIEESLSFNEYWSDERFQMKKPNLSGPLIQQVGDNFYHTVKNSSGVSENMWKQLPSLHRQPGHSNNALRHLTRDTGTNRVLIASHFTYWGGQGPRIPQPLFGRMFSRPYGVNHSNSDVQQLSELLSFERGSGRLKRPSEWTKAKPKFLLQ